MGRLHHHHLSLVTIALLLLAAAAAAAAAAVEDPEDQEIRLNVQYPTEEESQWLDRWAEKYRAKEPSNGFSVHPATDEESAYLNRIFADGKKGGSRGDSGSGNAANGGGGARAGFEGHIEFDDESPFGRIVVDNYHSGPRSGEPKDDLLQNKAEEYHAEHDVMEL